MNGIQNIVGWFANRESAQDYIDAMKKDPASKGIKITIRCERAT